MGGTCSATANLWHELNLEEVRARLATKTSAMEVLQAIWELEEKKCILVVTLLWHWWLERNRVREGEKRREVAGLAFIIRCQAEEFMKVTATENSRTPRTLKKWSKPVGDVLKINSDGAFDPATKRGGWGFVICDFAGDVIHAGAGVVLYAMDALHTEVLGCLAALKAAGDPGMRKVIAETDSMLLKMMAVGTGNFSLAPTGGLIHEIKEIAATNFTAFSMSYCSRLCNKVAHELASWGCRCSPNSDLYWDGVPTGMESLVAGDLAELLS
ncbi:hypothetical protein C2845_PM04G07650 [Panicum miliaceum]|uniref:RNase H type-1 domain-containing protein n=1 Tax=Panicum miliaceum TaxID=4540 RepID=A0A3L6QPA3_PANMI|nr:hypothetical protein C2845_PM04G07650 [Panicum miliaceum]